MRFVKKNETVRYPTSGGGWVELYKELTGPEEKKRRAVYRAAALRLSSKDIEAAQAGRVDTPGVDVIVADVEVALADFDVPHYLADWSESIPCTPENIAKLDDPSYEELLEIIKKHRDATVPDKAAVKNSEPSSASTSTRSTSSTPPAESPKETSEESPPAPASTTPSPAGGM
ncbi:MAG: hypothetical protein WC911_03535 [Thermoleophilia bacterium]